LDKHCVARADSRALLSVGSRMLIMIAMIPITTSSSTSVKPRFFVETRDIVTSGADTDRPLQTGSPREFLELVSWAEAETYNG
jgi:hypothetical protein